MAEYEFTGTFRQYGEGNSDGWNFLFMPAGLAGEIRARHREQEGGWGRLKVKARVGESEWATSLWFDTKNGTYLLPVKAEIRKREKIDMRAGSELKVTLWV